MTYRCGIGIGMDVLCGLEPGPPRITCDGCGVRREVRTASGGMPAWLREGKAPRGWACDYDKENFTRKDWCPRCRPVGTNRKREAGK